jgi:hypothetical protein
MRGVGIGFGRLVIGDWRIGDWSWLRAIIRADRIVRKEQLSMVFVNCLRIKNHVG